MSDILIRSTPLPTERTAGGTAVVTVRGEIDLLTTPGLAARLDRLTAGPCPDLVVDLRPVSFMDCAGLGVLCRARNRVSARHGRLRLVTDSTGFRRILRHVDLAGVFEVLPCLPEGVAETPTTDADEATAGRPHSLGGGSVGPLRGPGRTATGAAALPHGPSMSQCSADYQVDA
ncbi:STAS domain-containing protein [Streptomyces bottropensis]|jgi:anti-sigma B factor antagonist|uniref:STAS domain-containing protein n=2 Tax=Streptomyces bottropensis TaxID=42235 RepID=UPI000997AC2A|nr:anti-sigma factor antagonist [Streptomyces sp. SID5476]